ncbi:MAG: BlaI/MecI/CopY family transcriptional regulator [Candidatus Acidiferrales bacterium]|jgi:predicted transcriptional regulator
MDERNARPANQSDVKSRPPRRALLDLAPLELECLNTLWPMGEGTVREIRNRLAERLPRAYTTIMTIMDRLARKGIVERRKTGRAYVYRANLSAEEARAQALGQVVDKFFGGSKDALLAQLAAPTPIPLVRAAAAGGSASAVAGIAVTPAASESAQMVDSAASDSGKG